MKKLRVFVFVSLLLLAGCNGKWFQKGTAPPAVPLSFESDLLVIINETELTAHMKNKSIVCCCFTFNTPKHLEGLSLSFENNMCKLEHNGLAFEMNMARFPETAFGSALVNAMIAIFNDTNIEKSKVNDDWHYKGESKSGNFLYIQNGISGAPKYLSVPSLDLTVEFSNFADLPD